MVNEKIVVTGMGVITPGATNVVEFEDMLVGERSGLSKIENIGPDGESIVGGFIEDNYIEIEGKNYKRYPKFSRLAIATAEEALKMANAKESLPKRTTVIACTSTGGVKEVEFYSAVVRENRLKELPLQATALCNNHSISTGVASHFGIRHHAFTVNDSCNASIDGLFLAKTLLETNQTDMVILTGAESPFTQGMVYSFNKTRSVLYDQEVAEVGRPFSKNSKGYALSEGAATIILEREGSALTRGAEIYGFIKRIGLSYDGVSILQSDTTGEVMYEALEEACQSDTPDYVNSQALGLKENDTIEYVNHKKKFGVEVPITTIKGHVGQALGVVGLIQLVASFISMKEGFIPATIRTDLEGYEDLPVPLKTIKKEINSILLTCHGFGGNNGCVFLERK